MSKQFWAILIVIAAVFVGVVAFSGKDEGSNNASTAKPTNHVKGTSTTGVKLVEYGDFQCPVCALYAPTIDEVMAKYNDKISFQFRNLPLSSIHPNAFAAARAAEAAGEQNKYWEMYTLIYQNQTAWSNSSTPSKLFEGYASSLGLNIAKFKSDYASSKTNAAINADIKEFDKLKDEKSTPAFYLDGKRVDLKQVVDETTNAPTVEKFSKLIDAAIAAKTKNSQ